MDDPSQTPPLRLGMTAPNFRARTTRGELILSTLRGHWVVLFSHPADFTPVCTSEFIAFAKAQPRFDALDCRLIGLSVDSLPSHFGWIEAIRRDLGVEIGFPIIEDPSMAIARAYGMLDANAQDSSTVRSTFIIAPDGTIQSILTYPLSVGRSVAEILRTVQALQRAMKGDALTPEGWDAGERLFRPPPQTLEGMKSDDGHVWYHDLEEDFIS
ncbi:peroxiredoxin [Asaia krungthepensis]|uniref:Alkyl hydroperoxide reductase C n=1 Tax=Asaia krungthepensis NRIC 0535 TaxID=1307925 RepID=A0ABQ0Q6L1_9PROT|nr:peroxiredoxin [Asaia krungthepensis]GBQ93758.1 peroxiredoxin [Asaia krungthepensis NRIC 0535]